MEFLILVCTGGCSRRGIPESVDRLCQCLSMSTCCRTSLVSAVSTSRWWTIICCSLTTLCSCVSVAARAAHLALSFVLHLLSLCSAVSAAWHALTRLFLCFFSPQLSFPEHDHSILTTPVEVSFSHIENMGVRLRKMTRAFFFKTWLHYHKYEYIYCTAYEYIQTYRHHSHSTH